MYERKQHEPLDKEEWERRTRENVETCDRLAEWFGSRPLTVEERIEVGRMIGRQMQAEKEFKSRRSE